MIEYIRHISAADTYPLRHEVMWPNMPINYIILPNDEQGIHFGLFVNDALISVVSLFIENNEAQFRKLATTSTEQGKGYGADSSPILLDMRKGKKCTKYGVMPVWTKRNFI